MSANEAPPDRDVGGGGGGVIWLGLRETSSECET